MDTPKNWHQQKSCAPSSHMSKFELLHFADDLSLAETAATQWLNELSRAGALSRPYTVALSGGRIMRRFFEAVAQRALVHRFSWTSVHFFWADERCVPPEDAESNFRMARELLLEPLSIPEGQIHR